MPAYNIYSFDQVLASEFTASVPNPQLNLIKHLKAVHSNSHLVSTVVSSESHFPLSDYLAFKDISNEVVKEATHLAFDYDSRQTEKKVYPQVVAGVSNFRYARTQFQGYKASWKIDREDHIFYGLVFDGNDDSIGQQLASEVYKYANDLKEEIWVYESGYWSKSKPLHKAIRSAKWEDIVLKDEFKDGLRRDTETFFSSQDVYDSLGMTWKRGILLLGPPGNGKTESIKALLNEFGHNALYVKSFTTPYGPEYGVRTIFDHARKHSPCILVLEDLDSMVTEKVKSFFLNELDGLAQNDGILTIATTNHPERIDDSILNRPSRFDVKYNFTLPEYELRKAFAEKWISKVEGLGTAAAAGDGVVFGKKCEEVAKDVAEKTDGWSFAFLKELFVSFLLRLAHDKSLRKSKPQDAVSEESPETILMNQIEQLSLQILKTKVSVKGKPDVDSEANDEPDKWCPPPVSETEHNHAGPKF